MTRSNARCSVPRGSQIRQGAFLAILFSQTADKNNNPVLNGRYSLYLLFAQDGNIVFALGQMCVALKQYLSGEMV